MAAEPQAHKWINQPINRSSFNHDINTHWSQSHPGGPFTQSPPSVMTNQRNHDVFWVCSTFVNVQQLWAVHVYLRTRKREKKVWITQSSLLYTSWGTLSGTPAAILHSWKYQLIAVHWTRRSARSGPASQPEVCIEQNFFPANRWMKPLRQSIVISCKIPAHVYWYFMEETNKLVIR